MPSKTAAAEPPDLSNLPACIEDARAAALERKDGPPDPSEFRPLRTRLDAARKRIFGGGQAVIRSLADQRSTQG